MADEQEEESMFNILLATDIHLGYNERHPDRGNDSFVTFEEILNYGKILNVDFILLGGDLFHENKPSRKSLQRCMDLLRKYCLGPKATEFDFLSDPQTNFKDCATPQVNFEDPNFRISLPIFSIHGNHDDPCGEGNYSVMDMLASSGFVNYFGKVQNFEILKFQPILLKKGDTLLSIYGIGSVNDDRLFRMFEEEKVRFDIPEEFENDWFNILVLHQNRARHGSKNYTGEHLLPDFVDLVFWGHEHECKIEPEDFEDKFWVTQPGSSVATSLCPAEAVPKHIGLLKVFKKEFTIEPLPLKTVRPLVFDTISLDEFNDIGNQFASDEVIDRVRCKLEEMLKRAEGLISGHPMQPLLPLLRLRIEHENENQFGNARELEVKIGLEKRVSNPDEVIKLVRKRTLKEKIEAEVDEEAWDAVFNMDSINMIEGQLEKLLVDYFQESSKKQLLVMHERTLAEAVRSYVEKVHDDAFSDIIPIQVAQTKDLLKDKRELERGPFREAFAEIRSKRDDDPKLVIEEAHKWLSGEITVVKKTPKKENDMQIESVLMHDFAIDAVSASSPPVRGRGRARTKARATKSMGAGSRGRAKPSHDDENDEITVIDDEPRKERGKCSKPRGTRGRSSQSIASAFAKQSQTSTKPALAITSTASSNQSSRSARGICYISDSDD